MTDRSLHAGSHVGESPVRLVYLLAASHSGSTLLAMLLASHPEICTVGELKLGAMGDVNGYLCSCREPIRTCPFWTAVGREMEMRGHRFDIASAGTDILGVESRYARFLLRPLHRSAFWERIRDAALALSPEWRNGFLRVQTRNRALVEALGFLTGRKVIVDSSKIGLRLKYLLRTPELDVRVVRLIRDGRAVSLTYMDPSRFADAADSRLRGGGFGGTRERGRRSFRDAALEWRRGAEEAEAILKGLPPDRWIEVRYEELCRQPDITLRRLFAFAGVRTDVQLVNFRDRDHHIIGNGMRLDTTGEIRLDERWRQTLSSPDLQAFEETAGAMNRRLGYV